MRKLDRLARSLREGIDTLADGCKQDVQVVSATQQIDLGGKVGQMVAAILFALPMLSTSSCVSDKRLGLASLIAPHGQTTPTLP